MIFEILRGAGRDPSVITGGDLRLLQAQGLPGNALAGGSDLLVIEADESDGSLVRYAPAVGVILNLQRDHKEMAEVAAMFACCARASREALVVGEDENLDAPCRRRAPLRLRRRARIFAGEDVALGPSGSRFRVEQMSLQRCRCRARHNVANALAAIAACRALGVPLAEMVAPLALPGRRPALPDRRHDARRRGGRRLRPQRRQDRRRARARRKLRASRVLAIYQPHGYGPTRFLRRDFVDTFARELRPDDRLWMLEVFYAGGTAVARFLRRRHREPRSPHVARTPSSRPRATGLRRASPPRRAPATSCW